MRHDLREGLVLTRCDACNLRQFCAVNGTALCERCCPGAVAAAREEAAERRMERQAARDAVWMADVDVHHRVVLDVGLVADLDRSVVAANGHAEPDADIGAEPDVTHDDGVVGDHGIADAPEPADHVGGDVEGAFFGDHVIPTTSTHRSPAENDNATMVNVEPISPSHRTFLMTPLQYDLEEAG